MHFSYWDVDKGYYCGIYVLDWRCRLNFSRNGTKRTADVEGAIPDSKRALNQRWINLRIFNQNMLNQRWDRASIQRQFAHTVHRRFNVEWEANDDGASIPFQPLFNDYGRILVDSTAVCSYCSRSIQRWMEGGRRRRVDPFSTFIQLVIMVELWSMLVLHSLIYLKDIMIWLYN